VKNRYGIRPCFTSIGLAAVIVGLMAATPALAAQLTLTWTDNSSDELGFRIERRFNPAGSYSEITIVDPNVTSYVDTTVAPGQDYCYRIRAYNFVGTSEYSNESCGNPILFTGGVFVASGRIDGIPGAEIITGPGPGGGPHVKVLRANGVSLGPGFMAYDPAFTGGVRVAACDFDGDGRDEIVTAPGPGGGSHVRVFQLDPAGNVTGELAGFFAYPPAFTGGAFVACGDVDGDGVSEIITGADAGGGPHVRILRLQGSTVVSIFELLAYHPTFTGGVRVAAGNVDGSDRASLITAPGPGGGPHVRAIKLLTSGGTVVATMELASFFAYHPASTGGVFVAAGNVTGNGLAEIITGADTGGGPHVLTFSAGGAALGGGFFAYHPAFTGGVRVASGNLDAAGTDEIVTGAGPTGSPHILGFSGAGALGGTSFFPY
jgi:FG-GAP-like repeat